MRLSATRHGGVALSWKALLAGAPGFEQFPRFSKINPRSSPEQCESSECCCCCVPTALPTEYQCTAAAAVAVAVAAVAKHYTTCMHYTTTAPPTQYVLQLDAVWRIYYAPHSQPHCSRKNNTHINWEIEEFVETHTYW